MGTLAIELSDAGFLTAACDAGAPHLIDVPDHSGSPEWPGFCYADGTNLTFGRAAEDMWFVHPRRVVHSFWARLGHEPSALNVVGKPPSSSELAFFFLREFAARVAAAFPPPEKIVLAVPGAYLKDPATEEEKVGLLLGMAGELKLPLAGLVDLACAALCDPRSPGFNHALPVAVIDLGLEGADLTLCTTEGQLARRDFMHVPQCAGSLLLKHLTATMGNRFLRQTAFDILEDGRIEQTFFRQTKEFLYSSAADYRFVINTATRAYEMSAKRDQLAADAQGFVGPLVQSLQSFLRSSPHASEPCTVALTDRAASLPGLEARLRAAGFLRLVRLPRGAAACGAARIGAARMQIPADLAEVALATAVPLADAPALAAAPWEARLVKQRNPATNLVPTHAILAGLGQPIERAPRFTIGLAENAPDLALPADFGVAEGCSLPLAFEDGRLWFVDPTATRERGGSAPPPLAPRVTIEAGDRLVVCCGGLSAEILFAHCPHARRD